MSGKRFLLDVRVGLCLTLALVVFGQACSRGVGDRSAGLVFACFTYPDTTQYETPIWARSIRRFGGGLAETAIWVFVPNAVQDLNEDVREELSSLGVELHPFVIEEDALSFPLAAKVFGAAAAERLAEGKYDLLAWLDRDNIVVQEPSALLLPMDKSLGYRSVHHKNIGSYYDEPVDDFWQLLYQRLEVGEEAIFPMTTIVDTLSIRPYINAGHLVVRPERGLLQLWLDNFQGMYRDSAFVEFYQRDNRYAIFVHQAILTGTILHTVPQEEMVEFSDAYNYPLHLSADIPVERRAARLNDLVTPRYDFIGYPQTWRTMMVIDEPLTSWIDQQFGSRETRD